MVKNIPAGLRIFTWAFVALVLIFVLAPLIVVAGVSVSESQFIAFPPTGFSLRWFAAIFESDSYVRALLTSLKLAVLVTVGATVVGAGAAIAIHRGRLPGMGLLAGLFLSPLILPSIIFAIGLLMLWSATVGPVSFWALWIGHMVIALPYVIRTTLAVLSESDPFLEEAARTMGAARWQRIVYVVLPQCAPGLAAGAFFAFNISFDEAVVALFLRTPDLVTLPIQIYNQLEFSPDPVVAAVSTLMMGMTVLLIAIIDRFLGIQRFVGT
ncbi:ABC transporter permease [Microvirga thermotolerans]|uniref:ABC transporter permease subunit n=1 Tax=Microvirga thermotolerans TaxID=2651334 RepID=A0A5P9K0S0_9HYPH|nr:ABC transporter permease [Microvirga thermotolerans]QFU17516.1 ABC transporter permease subunit [Microvirga thermotolerans]